MNIFTLLGIAGSTAGSYELITSGKPSLPFKIGNEYFELVRKPKDGEVIASVSQDEMKLIQPIFDQLNGMNLNQRQADFIKISASFRVQKDKPDLPKENDKD